jgi:hypothetical protein
VTVASWVRWVASWVRWVASWVRLPWSFSDGFNFEAGRGIRYAKKGRGSLEQGDRMSLWKNRPKCSQTQFLVKVYAYPLPWKQSRTKVWAISVIFIERPKVNCDPLGENTPNLVTLEWSSLGRVKYVEIFSARKIDPREYLKCAANHIASCKTADSFLCLLSQTLHRTLRFKLRIPIKLP